MGAPAKAVKKSDRPRQRRLRAPARREQLIETSLGAFAERGYQVSIGELAATAGITRTVLYYYFPTKKDLFLAVLDRQVTELLRYLVPAVSSEGTPEERSRATMEAMLTFAESNPQAWDVLFEQRDETEGEDEVREVRQRVHEATMTAGADLLSDDLRRMELDPSSPRVRMLEEMGLGALLALVRWWRANPAVSRDEVLDVMDEMGRGALLALAGGAMAGRPQA